MPSKRLWRDGPVGRSPAECELGGGKGGLDAAVGDNTGAVFARESPLASGSEAKLPRRLPSVCVDKLSVESESSAAAASVESPRTRWAHKKAVAGLARGACAAALSAATETSIA